MLDKYRASQIKALLAEGHGIKTVAGMTGVSRNTVRRFQRNIPLKSHHGLAWRTLEANLEAIRKLFYDCRGNCSAMLPVCEGRHQRGTAEPAHAAEVLQTFSPGTPAEQTDEDGAL